MKAPDATHASDSAHGCHGPAELEALRQRGVRIPAPHLVAVGREVPLQAIASGAELRPFCRIEGAATRIDAGAVIGVAGAATVQQSWIGADARIGTLGPVTVRECALGPGTVLGCGVAEQAVLLGKESHEPDFSTGYGFRLRQGSLYEEDASSAQHTDTKMTILLPWVTLGSNINACDLLVSGGTGPSLGQFSELGSGAIHFNFTPRGDKATGSLLGDVTRGVFLRSERVFIGGNSSLLGPLQADYGAVAAAGGRYERVLSRGLNAPSPAQQGDEDFDDRSYGSVERIVRSQACMIGQLAALDAWYAHVRAHLARGDEARATLYARARELVRDNLRERIQQLGRVARRMEASAAALERRQPGDPRIGQQRALARHWPQLEAHLGTWEHHLGPPPASLLAALEAAAAEHGTVYTRVVRGLPEQAVAAGQVWLEGIAQAVAPEALLALVPPVRRLG